MWGPKQRRGSVGGRLGISAKLALLLRHGLRKKRRCHLLSRFWQADETISSCRDLLVLLSITHNDLLTALRENRLSRPSWSDKTEMLVRAVAKLDGVTGRAARGFQSEIRQELRRYFDAVSTVIELRDTNDGFEALKDARERLSKTVSGVIDRAARLRAAVAWLGVVLTAAVGIGAAVVTSAVQDFRREQENVPSKLLVERSRCDPSGLSKSPTAGSAVAECWAYRFAAWRTADAYYFEAWSTGILDLLRPRYPAGRDGASLLLLDEGPSKSLRAIACEVPKGTELEIVILANGPLDPGVRVKAGVTAPPAAPCFPR